MKEKATQTKTGDISPQQTGLAPVAQLSDHAPAHPMVQLQRTVGNQAVQRLIQTKLELGKPGDAYEHEADRIADEIVRMETVSPPLHVRRTLQRSAADDVGGMLSASPLVDEVLASGGRPLDKSVRRFMEPRFGHDFSRVRVHTDDAASRSTQAVSAHAYTVGDDIAFCAGKYAPGTQDGNRLLAHELTHVVQQTGGSQLSDEADIGGRFSRSGPTRQTVLQREDAPRAATLDDVDQQLLDNQIALVVGLARGNFVSAIANARTQLALNEIHEAAKTSLFQNISVAIGTLFLPGVLNVLSTTVQGVLKDTLPSMLKGPLAADRSAAFQLIAEKFTPAAISGYVTSAQSVLKSKDFDVLGNDKYARTSSYLDGLDSLNAEVMTESGLNALQAGKEKKIHFFAAMKYLAANASVYREDVLTRSTHFLNEVADVILGDDVSASIVGPQLCKIDAYGRDRWARVQVGSLSGWVFLQWVDPDAAEALESQARGKRSIPRLSPEDIVGHLPDPVLESGGQKTPGGEPMRTEWTNAWGGLRLVEVAVPHGMQGTGEYLFRRWIPASEQAAAIARGQHQIGGLDPTQPINSDKIRGKEPPLEPPLR
jgi:hypothetical protein